MDGCVDGSYIVSVLIIQDMRGRSVGLAELRARAILMQGHTLCANIDDRNKAPPRLFSGAGFVSDIPTLYRREPA